MASAAEAETGSIFLNGQQAVPICTALIDMGHPQPPNPIKTDSATFYGILTGNMNQKRSKAFDMRCPLDALPHQAESIPPVLAEGNQKPCRLLHQALSSRSPTTDKVRIPSTCKFENLLKTQDSSARVCSLNGLSGCYPLSSHCASAPSVTSRPRLH